MVKACDSLAIVVGKLSASAIRSLGAGLGSNLPGKVARRLSPGLLSRLAAHRRKGVLAVTGTNGKSTTCGIIHSILRTAGFKVVHNRQGANLVTGITASVLDAANWTGFLDADYCLFEIDEATLPVVAAEVEFSATVVTNLFRDQLDRFGELDTTAQLINKGINQHPGLAVLNADDPNVAQLAPQASRIYYGIQSLDGKQQDASSSATSGIAREFSSCAQCGAEYNYQLIFFDQLGHYSCSQCGQTRPSPQVYAENVSVNSGGCSFLLTTPRESLPVHLPLPGLFNVYNALAAAALAVQLNIPIITIKEGLAQYTTLFGRSERLQVEGKPVLVQLIKNPAGTSQVLNSVSQDETARLLIAINDNLADGRDISWLWDAHFELLAEHSHKIVLSGKRAADMAVRLKYAGLPSGQIQVISSLELAIKQTLNELPPGQTLCVLPTYTCLLELQKIFRSMGTVMSAT